MLFFIILMLISSRCNQLASLKGFTHFGIQLYGECWAGNGTQYLRDGKSTECVNSGMKECKNDSPIECTGKCGANYVYKVNRKYFNFFSRLPY